MDFGAGLDESLLGARQIAANALDRIESEHGLGILIRSMKVWPVVRGADFDEHPNDDSEESRNLKHWSMRELSVSVGGLTSGISRGALDRASAVGCMPC
jgi:hypothetical protein